MCVQVDARRSKVRRHHADPVASYQTRLREGTIGYVKSTLLHSTLREMQALLFSPRFWGAVLAVSAILGVTGPFGTLQQLDLLPRFAYWLALAFATFSVGYLSMRLTLGVVFGMAGTRPVRSVVAGIAAGLPVTATVMLFNHALFGGPVSPAADIAKLFVNCSLIAIAVSFLVTMAGRGAQGTATPDAIPSLAPAGNGQEGTTDPFPSPALSPQVRPPLIDRLPHAVRGRLSHLSMQDHYVEVHTDKGSTLVLMRLADAIREVGDIPGVQIHRSHWVALDAVTGRLRKLADDVTLPVSRSYTDAVRRAGLA